MADDIDRALDAIERRTRSRYAVLHKVLVWVVVDFDRENGEDRIIDAYTARSLLNDAEVLDAVYTVDPDDAQWGEELSATSEECRQVMKWMKDTAEIPSIRIEEHL